MILVWTVTVICILTAVIEASTYNPDSYSVSMQRSILSHPNQQLWYQPDHTNSIASTNTRTGRARVVVDEHLLNEEVSPNNCLIHPGNLQRIQLHLPGLDEKKWNPSNHWTNNNNNDLQLVWSEPTTTNTNKEDCYNTLSHRLFHQMDSPYSLPVRDTPTNTRIASTTTTTWSQRYTSTGTTIVGIAGPNYCILASDSRATSGRTVATNTCFKLHPLSINCVAAGAGTAADLDQITRECEYATRLTTQNGWCGNPSTSSSSSSSTKIVATITTTTNNMETYPVPVHQMCRYLADNLFRHGGSRSAYLIVGGVYHGQSMLRAIHAQGSMDVVSYTALGSGSLAALSVLERRYDRLSSPSTTVIMSMDEAIALAIEAVRAGIENDLGSGSQVDLCVIGPDGIANFTRCVHPEEMLYNVPSTLDGPSQQHVWNTVSTTSTTTTTTDNIPSKKNIVVEAHGVNGFGNVPYTIRSQRIVQASYQQIQQRERDRWHEILGT